MANLNDIHQNTLTNEQLAYWIGGKVSTRNRDLVAELDEDKSFINEEPAKFVGDLNKMMLLLDILGY